MEDGYDSRLPEGGLSCLEARALGLTLAGREVLDGIDAVFPAGHVTAVVGPSGAGKTSLLRCLNRLVEPTEGIVLLDDSDVRQLPPTALRRKVGLISQTPVVFPGGVRANLNYGARVSDDDARLALGRAGLPGDFLDRGSEALSMGQAQRVCIARALVREPEALLMDEPTSALDKDAARKIEDLIVELAASGLIVVVVTHNLEQAIRIAAGAVLVKEGRVIASGAPNVVADAWPEDVS